MSAATTGKDVCGKEATPVPSASDHPEVTAREVGEGNVREQVGRIFVHQHQPSMNPAMS
jgi:hypothetical protein